MAKTTAQPLTGEELISKVNSMKEADKKEKAKACGYYTLTKNGQERVNVVKFQNALIKAIGFDLEGSDEAPTRGRAPTFKVSVHRNGNLLIGAAYTKKMSLNPGDEFDIKISGGTIKLERVEEE
ncbi:MAG: AbrB family transcriptional regulator [Synechococcales cyanobacterium]